MPTQNCRFVFAGGRKGGGEKGAARGREERVEEEEGVQMDAASWGCHQFVNPFCSVSDWLAKPGIALEVETSNLVGAKNNLVEGFQPGGRDKD